MSSSFWAVLILTGSGSPEPGPGLNHEVVQILRVNAECGETQAHSPNLLAGLPLLYRQEVWRMHLNSTDQKSANILWAYFLYTADANDWPLRRLYKFLQDFIPV